MLADVMKAKAGSFAEPFKSGILETQGHIRKKKPDIDWMLLLLA